MDLVTCLFTWSTWLMRLVVTPSADRWRWLTALNFSIFNGKLNFIIGIWQGEIDFSKLAHREGKFEWIPTFSLNFNEIRRLFHCENFISSQLFDDNRYGEPQFSMAENNHGIIDFFRLLNGSVSWKSISCVDDNPPISKFVKKKLIEWWNVHYLFNSSHNSFSHPFPSKFV